MTFVFFILFLIFIPLNKAAATPSFVLLSILFYFIIFTILEKIISNFSSLKILEYVGRKSLGYWLMMYIVFLIPLWFYIDFSEQIFPLNLQWYIAIAISLGMMMLLYTLFRMVEYITISK